MSDPLVTIPIWRLSDSPPQATTDHVVAEEPLQIRINGAPWQTILRTPGADSALLTGLLFAESIISTGNDIVTIASVETAPEDFGNTLDVQLRGDLTCDVTDSGRVGIMTSACGFCGKSLLDSLDLPAVTDPLRIDPHLLAEFPARLREQQELFASTGGIHAAGLFTATGELLALAEDVGRHNAVDKVIGILLMAGLTTLPGTILQISGRGGYEILLKAWKARIPLVAAVGAPSSLAVELARRAGITLVGFMRGLKANVYTHPERLGLGDSRVS